MGNNAKHILPLIIFLAGAEKRFPKDRSNYFSYNYYSICILFVSYLHCVRENGKSGIVKIFAEDRLKVFLLNQYMYHLYHICTLYLPLLGTGENDEGGIVKIFAEDLSKVYL